MAEIENGKYYELGSRTFWLLVLQRSAISLMLLFFAAIAEIAGITGLNSQMTPVFDKIFNFTIIGATLLAILFEIIGIAVAKLEYGVSRVILDESSLRIVRGIFNKDEVVLPYRRIQSVEIEQTFLQRVLRVGRLVILSTTDLEQTGAARNEANDEIVPSMDYDLAKAFTNVLTNRAEIEEMQIQQSNKNSLK